MLWRIALLECICSPTHKVGADRPVASLLPLPTPHKAAKVEKRILDKAVRHYHLTIAVPHDDFSHRRL